MRMPGSRFSEIIRPHTSSPHDALKMNLRARAHMMPTSPAHLAPLQASSHLPPRAPSACYPLFYLMLSATSRRPR